MRARPVWMVCGLVALTSPGVLLAAGIQLRIVTYNVKEGVADTVPAREALGNVLTTLDLDGGGPNTSLMPDIVCLQETRSQSAMNSFRNDYLPGYQSIRGTITDGFNANGFFLRPDITLLRLLEVNTGGPRRVLRAILDIPGTPEHLVVYNAHFKAGGTPDDIATRTVEANALANRVASDQVNGFDLDDDMINEFFPTSFLVVGDLNQHDFSGTAIDALLSGGDNGLPTNLNDVRMETLLGATIGGTPIVLTFSTQGSFDSRYDYFLASDAVFDTFDANGNGIVNQAELNAAGFVYLSGDDFGLLSSGDVDATTAASDHAPVVLHVTLPCIVGDLDCDGSVGLADLSALLTAFGTSIGDMGYDPDADIDGSGSVDLGDLSALLTNFGTSG